MRCPVVSGGWLGRCRDTIPSALNDLLADRESKVAVLLGSGLGRYALPKPLPTGTQLRDLALAHLKLPEDVSLPLDHALQYILNQEHLPGLLRFVRKHIQGREWSGTHALMAGLACSQYWSTNWDPLLQEAARAIGRPLDVVTRAENVELGVGNRRLFLPHGSLDDPKQIVATTTDLLNWSKGSRLGGWHPLIQSLFRDYTVIIVGFSLSDVNFQTAYFGPLFDRSQQDGGPMHYLVRPGINDHAKEYWKKFGITCVDAGAEELAVGLTMAGGGLQETDETTWDYIVSAYHGCTVQKARELILKTRTSSGLGSNKAAAIKCCRVTRGTYA